MSKLHFRVTVLAIASVLGSIVYMNSADANSQISVGGATLTIPSNIYQPTGYDTIRADIPFSNNSGVELLSIGYSVTDAYGKVIAWDSKVGVPAGTSGLLSRTWFGSDFANATAPLTMTLIVKRFGGLGDLITSGTLTLLAKPGSSPLPGAVASPAPTVTVTASPRPAPTVTVTASPLPAPTVTVTAQANSDLLMSQLEVSNLKLGILEKENASLKAKVKKICSAKPKPKGC
jgi:hypothetical protein